MLLRGRPLPRVQDGPAARRCTRIAPKMCRAPSDAWVLECFGGITVTSGAVPKEDDVGAHELTIS